MYRTREQIINDLSRVGHRWLDEEVRNPLNSRVIDRKNDNNESVSAIKNDSGEQVVDVPQVDNIVSGWLDDIDNEVIKSGDTGEKIDI